MYTTKMENTHLQECDKFGNNELLRPHGLQLLEKDHGEATEYGGSREHYELGSY